VSYDPVKDFVPITRVGSFTLMLVIDPKLPIHSVKELVDYAKANPGRLSFASGNTAGIVAGDTLAKWAGINILHVPYKTTPPALEDIIGGRVSMMFADFTTAIPHVNSGALRALAVTRIKRSSLFPDLPTMDEAGIKGFNLDAWAGLVAPAGTPPEIVTKLNSVLRPIIDSPQAQAKFKNVGFEAFSSSPEELGDYIKLQLGLWGKMVKDANIQSD
jgi:tripartite-type tricarboxylate transporter receptor subunit TctC